MTRELHFVDQSSTSDGKIVGVMTTVALILAGFLSVISFAAI